MRGIPDFADGHPGYEALGPRFRGDERTWDAVKRIVR